MVVDAELPKHLEDSLQRYLEHGILPGGFLTACLENNLTEAVCHADIINTRLLPEIVSYLLMAMPRNTWGDPETVRDYVLSKKREFANG